MNGIERRLQRIEEAAAQRSRGRMEAGRIDLKGFIAPCYYGLDDDVQNGRFQYFNLPGQRNSTSGEYANNCRSIVDIFNRLRTAIFL